MKKPNLAGKIYLALLCAESYPEQEPDYQVAKWYDLFWLLIPAVGIVSFLEVIEARYIRENRR